MLRLVAVSVEAMEDLKNLITFKHEKIFDVTPYSDI